MGILDRREPRVAAGVFIVQADEGIVSHGLEAVLRADRRSPGGIRAGCIVDCRLARDRIALYREPALRVFGEARAGITGRRLDREPASQHQFALYIAAPGDRGAEVVGELKSAAADVDILLDAVPLDVIDAGGDPQSIGDGVF